MERQFVVVGGDAAGMSAASKAKRDDPETDVVVFERGEWVSYAACGMPYYVAGVVDDLDDLVTITPEEFRSERGIDVRTGREVTEIDPERNRVTVSDGDETDEQSYDDLLLATGAHAVRPPIDGLDRDGVYVIHDMADARAIREAIDGDGEPPRSAGILGGGYVGVEMAEAFAERGLDVHLFEMLEHVLDPFGAETASVVEDHLREQGVDLRLGTAITGFGGDDRVERVETETDSVPVDVVVVGAGVAPNADLAAEAGIEVGPIGAVATDEYGRTSEANVYAAGDCAEARHVVTGEPTHVPLALTANRAGRAIGATVAGTPTPVGDVAGTAIVKAFDLEVARTGVLDHETAREAGFDPVTATITDRSRAHYYPGGAEITVTLTADRESERVLGASVVGADRAGKRIDAVAAALHAGATVTELERFDLAYAPPFSPVWDPVLTAARVLDGRLDDE